MTDPRTEPEPTDPPAADPDRGRVPPVLYPIGAAAFVAVLVWSFSRILLAVSTLTLHVGHSRISGKSATAVIALLMALNVLVGSALVAYGRRVRRRPASFPLLVAAGVLVVAGGVAALSVKSPSAQAKTQVVALDAQGIAFIQRSLTFASGGPVTIAFDNRDPGLQHNFVLFNGKDATAPMLFRGDVVTGPATIRYSFTAPPPGTYFFHCEIHPAQMTGTVTVTPGAPGGAASGLNLTAKGIAFSPTELVAPAGGQITIHFNNQDSGTPHNVVVFNGSDATAPMLFSGALITGPATQDYTFAAPPPGTYFFHCAVHPAQMQGMLVVGSGSASSGPSGAPSPSG